MQNFKSTGSTGAGSETGGRQSVPLPTAQHPAQLTSLETLVRENGELRFLLKSLTEESAARGAIESVRLQSASAATAKTVEALSRRLELAAAETQRLELAVSLRDRALLEAEALGLRLKAETEEAGRALAAALLRERRAVENFAILEASPAAKAVEPKLGTQKVGSGRWGVCEKGTSMESEDAGFDGAVQALRNELAVRKAEAADLRAELVKRVAREAFFFERARRLEQTVADLQRDNDELGTSLRQLKRPAAPLPAVEDGSALLRIKLAEAEARAAEMASAAESVFGRTQAELRVHQAATAAESASSAAEARHYRALSAALEVRAAELETQLEALRGLRHKAELSDELLVENRRLAELARAGGEASARALEMSEKFESELRDREAFAMKLKFLLESIEKDKKRVFEAAQRASSRSDDALYDCSKAKAELRAFEDQTSQFLRELAVISDRIDFPLLKALAEGSPLIGSKFPWFIESLKEPLKFLNDGHETRLPVINPPSPRTETKQKPKQIPIDLETTFPQNQNSPHPLEKTLGKLKCSKGNCLCGGRFKIHSQNRDPSANPFIYYQYN